MVMTENEAKLAQRTARFLKAELKRADVTYGGTGAAAHGTRIERDGRDSIAAKLKRGTFAATFFIACLAALEMEGIRLEDI